MLIKQFMYSENEKLKKDAIIFGFGIVLVIIVLLLFQFLLYSRGFYAISNDEAGHTLEGFWWYKGHTNIFSIWLPFQKILYGIAFHIYYNLFWVPRVLSSLFGILTLLSLIFLTNELFQDKIVSTLAGFLGSVFWGIIIFSVVPLTEIYFLFFVITSLTFLLCWKRTNNEIFLWLTVVLSGIGTSIRYEAWIFSFLLFIIITIKIYSDEKELQKKVIKIVGIIILLFSFPLLWIYLSLTVTSQSTGFLNHVVERYQAGGILTEIKNNVLYKFLVINIFSLNIFGLLTLVFYYKKDSKLRTYTVIFLSTLLIMSIGTFITKAMPTHNFWRLTSIWSIMLLPLTAKWLYDLFMEDKVFLKFSALVIFLMIILFFNRQKMDFSSYSYLSKDDITIGKYLNNKMKTEDPDSKIFIERNGWEFTNILVTSQIPDRFITDEEYFRNVSLHADSLMRNKDFINGFKKYSIRYLILKPNSYLSQNISDLVEIKNFIIWKVFKPK
jgi:hypothetical protein